MTRRGFSNVGIIFLFAILVEVFSQDAVDERIRGRCQPTLDRPTGVLTDFFGIGITHASISWNPLPRASRFIVRVYSMNDDVLRQEANNVRDTAYNITDLQPETFYRATVAAVYLFPDTGFEHDSCESEPEVFVTLKGCPAEQIMTQCIGHCIASCGDPDPVCDRRCTQGCNCPSDRFIWHQGHCIVPALCPATRETVKRPKNLKITPLGDSIILSWDKVEGAIGYTVKVRLTSNRQLVIQEINTDKESAHITGLLRGEEYSFVVSAVMSVPVVPVAPNVGARSFPAPDGVVVSDVTDDGFLVTWLLNPNARRYALVVYLEDKTTAIYSNSHLARGTVQITGLAPGTTYYIAVSAAGYKGNLEELSPLRGVQTSGTKDPSMDYLGSSISAVPIAMTTQEPTTTTTPKPLTPCQSDLALVTDFYEQNPNAVSGPDYPTCTAEGLYQTQKCPTSLQGVCYCIDPQTGVKKFGTDNGLGVSGVSQIPLDCDNYGNFIHAPSNVQASNIKSTEATISWTGHPDTFGYVLVIVGYVEVIQSVIEDTSVTISVVPGLSYTVSVMAVSVNGWTSPAAATTFTTPYVDMPANIRMGNVGRNSGTIRWDRSSVADSYSVTLLNQSTFAVIQKVDVTTNRVTLNQLEQSTSYIVRVRSVATRDGAVHESAYAEIVMTTQCNLNNLDLIYSIDISSAAGFNALEIEKNFFANLTVLLPKIEAENGTRIAAVKYFDRASTVFDFARFKSTGNLVGALKYMRYVGRTVRRGHMLNVIYNEYFHPQLSPRGPGWRFRSNSVPVVIVFAASPTRENIETSAQRLSSATNVIAVGVQGITSRRELDLIASSPDNVVIAPSWDELVQQKNQVVSILCKLAA